MARLRGRVVALVVVPATGRRALRLVPPGRLGGASLELWLVCIHQVGRLGLTPRISVRGSRKARGTLLG